MPRSKPSQLKALPDGLPDEKTINLMMALREIIMEYYQGSCVEHLVRDKDIVVMNLGDFIDHGPQWRMRAWELEQSNPRLVLLEDKPLFTLERKKLILYVTNDKTDVIKREVERFMAKYLKHIGIEHTEDMPEQARRGTLIDELRFNDVELIAYEEMLRNQGLMVDQRPEGFYTINAHSFNTLERPQSGTSSSDLAQENDRPEGFPTIDDLPF